MILSSGKATLMPSRKIGCMRAGAVPRVGLGFELVAAIAFELAGELLGVGEAAGRELEVVDHAARDAGVEQADQLAALGLRVEREVGRDRRSCGAG